MVEKISSIKEKIKKLQDYLGPKVDYTSDKFPLGQPERWLMEYLDILKKEYYKKQKRNKKAKKKERCQK